MPVPSGLNAKVTPFGTRGERSFFWQLQTLISLPLSLWEVMAMGFSLQALLKLKAEGTDTCFHLSLPSPRTDTI